MLSCRKHVDESLQSSVVEKFVACEAGLLAVFGRFSAVSRFAPGFHSEIRCRPIGLTLVGVACVGYSR